VIDSASKTKSHDPLSSEVVRHVFEHYRARLRHPRAKLDGKRAGLIRARLRDFSAEELCRAIDGVAQSDFHMGRHPKTLGQRHDDVELIFRDVAHVEKFLDIESGKVSGSSSDARHGSRQRNAGLTGFESLGENP
jgi:hypothetical protein